MNNFSTFKNLNTSDIRDIVMGKSQEAEEKPPIDANKNKCSSRVFLDTNGKKTTETTNIKEVSAKILFTDKTIWKVTNVSTERVYEVNGGIVNFWLTGVPDIRDRLESGQMSSFKTLNMLVAFEKAIF